MKYCQNKIAVPHLKSILFSSSFHGFCLTNSLFTFVSLPLFSPQSSFPCRHPCPCRLSRGRTEKENAISFTVIHSSGLIVSIYLHCPENCIYCHTLLHRVNTEGHNYDLGIFTTDIYLQRENGSFHFTGLFIRLKC